MDRADDRLCVGLDLVHKLHRLEDAERLAGAHRVPLLHERRRAGLRRPVEGADHRCLDADDAVAGGFLLREGFLGFRRGVLRGRRSEHGLDRIRRPPHRDAHPALVDRDLPHARLLDDADDLANSLGACLIDTARPERVGTCMPPANRLEQRASLVTEERQQQELLVACGQALGLVAQLLQVDRLRLGNAVGE